MKLEELEEGLINLIATQPNIMLSPYGKTINQMKIIIENFKAYCYSVEMYEGQDSLKQFLTNENAKEEMNLVAYISQTLQENGINIFLYITKYAGMYNGQQNKYAPTTFVATPMQQNFQPAQQPVMPQPNNQGTSQENNVAQNNEYAPGRQIHATEQETAKGRDYLMELLKK